MLGRKIMDLVFHGNRDNTPMTMISGARLAYYERLEKAVKELVATLAAKPKE